MPAPTFLFEVQTFFSIFVLTLKYIPTTLFLALVSMIAGLGIGTLIALARLCRIPVANRFCVIFVSFIRGTPLAVQILLVYFGIPIFFSRAFGISLVNVPAIGYAFIAFSFNVGAFLSELLRGAILSIDIGQQEAARTIGMTRAQMIRRILLPQAYWSSLPVLANNFISLLKSTSLAFSISVLDITGGAIVTASNGLRFTQAYLSALIIYVSLCTGFEKLFGFLEKTMLRYRRQRIL
jgi:His/Glu/Gln/Arg/opine family amino acid ABC transporter permease subunit